MYQPRIQFAEAAVLIRGVPFKVNDVVEVTYKLQDETSETFKTRSETVKGRIVDINTLNMAIDASTLYHANTAIVCLYDITDIVEVA